VGRWVSGQGQPSEHNLSRLSAYIAERAPGFGMLDWDQPIETLADVLRAKAEPAPGAGGEASQLAAVPLALLDDSRATTLRRGDAYEGFFRSTRPYPHALGRFMHDTVLIRRGADGDLCFRLASGGVTAEGAVLLLHNQLFIVGAELTSGSFAFAILNGVNTLQAGVLDGLILLCSLDATRTPTAMPVIFERTGDLSGDAAADDAAFAALAAAEPLAQDGSVAADVVAHLSRDIGPTHAAAGGEWLLSLPLAQSWSRGLGPARSDLDAAGGS
jgi:hypothetical protein